MNRTGIFSALLLAATLAGAELRAVPCEAPVWKIGVKDGSSAEFALHGEPYADVAKRFAEATALYTVGRSSAADIPFVIPGPADSWAGGPRGGAMIRFGARRGQPSAALRLRVDLVEAHNASAPRVEVRLNDYTTTVQVPRGSNQNYLDDGRTTSRDLHFEVEIPAGHLRAGDNVLSLRTVAGSWMVLDALRLDASEPVASAAPAGDVTLFSATSQPALVYGERGELRHPVVLRAAIWSSRPVKAAWSYDGTKGGEATLAPGLTHVDVSVPEGAEGRRVEFTLATRRGAHRAEAEILPAEKRTVYLVQHTHTDIGYTKPQTEILTEHLRYIDYAVEYCEATASYPDDARFRWTCEASWAVDEWLRIRPREQVEKFLDFVRRGQIEVTAMFFNMSELSGEGNYRAFLEPLERFRELEIPVVTAMQNDVNGVAWCLADYLPDLGVKYITMGSNGHRAGIPFDRPTLYRWESPSGKSLLAFRADHYHTANSWGIDRGDMAGVERGVFSYIERLRRRGYDFPIVAAQYSGYLTDNSPPSMQECALIRAWNECYAWPKLRSATAHEFLERIDEEYGDRLPVYRAAYPDFWTDGFGSAARETAASRKTQADMTVVEGMLSMAARQGDASAAMLDEEIRRIRRNLLFYDEHTFGAAESIRDPMCENAQVQWAEKGSYVWEALKSAQMLYETAAGRLQGMLYRSTRPTLTLFNASGAERSALATVYIDYEIIPENRAFRIVDERGEALAVQPIRSRREGRYYAVWADRVPAMGYKTYEIVLDEGRAAAPQSLDAAEGVAENDFYRMEFDPGRGGIRSLVDKQLGAELVDAGSEWSLGGVVYESLEGDRNQMERKVFEKYSREGLRDVRFTGADLGPIYGSYRFEGRLAGCDEAYGVHVEVRLYRRVKRIELCYSLRRLPERDPSSIYVAFPFALERGRLAFDVPGGLLRAGENQIPGSTASWNTVQSFATARNGEAQVIVSSDQVPLFLMGELLRDPYRLPRDYERPHLFSWVMNNYWTTNFRASQEGELRWSYALTSEEGSSEASAAAFGQDNRLPLYVRVVPAAQAANDRPRSWSAFRVGGDGVLAVGCVPSDAGQGALVVNLRETEGREATLTLVDEAGRPLRFRRVDILDRPMGDWTETLRLAPCENLFVRLAGER